MNLEKFPQPKKQEAKEKNIDEREFPKKIIDKDKKEVPEESVIEKEAKPKQYKSVVDRETNNEQSQLSIKKDLIEKKEIKPKQAEYTRDKEKKYYDDPSNVINVKTKEKKVDYSYIYAKEEYERKKDTFTDEKGDTWIEVTQAPRKQVIISGIASIFAPVAPVRMINKKSGFFLVRHPRFASKELSDDIIRESNYQEFLADRLILEKIIGDKDRDNFSNTFVFSENDKTKYAFYDFGNTTIESTEIQGIDSDIEWGQIGFSQMYGDAEENDIPRDELNNIIKEKLTLLKKEINNEDFVKKLKETNDVMPSTNENDNLNIIITLASINKKIEKLQAYIDKSPDEIITEKEIRRLEEKYGWYKDSNIESANYYKKQIEELKSNPLKYFEEEVKNDDGSSYKKLEMSEYRIAIESLKKESIHKSENI